MARAAGPADAAGMLDELLEVDGFAAAGWGGVRDAFAENFARRGDPRPRHIFVLQNFRSAVVVNSNCFHGLSIV